MPCRLLITTQPSGRFSRGPTTTKMMLSYFPRLKEWPFFFGKISQYKSRGLRVSRNHRVVKQHKTLPGPTNTCCSSMFQSIEHKLRHLYMVLLNINETHSNQQHHNASVHLPPWRPRDTASSFAIVNSWHGTNTRPWQSASTTRHCLSFHSVFCVRSLPRDCRTNFPRARIRPNSSGTRTLRRPCISRSSLQH